MLSIRMLSMLTSDRWNGNFLRHGILILSWGRLKRRLFFVYFGSITVAGTIAGSRLFANTGSAHELLCLGTCGRSLHGVIASAIVIKS